MSDPALKVTVPTVYLDGGLVQGLEGFPEGTRIDVIDYDAQEFGSTDDETCKCEAGDGEHWHTEITVGADGRW